MLSLVPPVVRGLLRPHLEDVDNKIQPGAVILTWASMNIDGYLHHIHQAGLSSVSMSCLLPATFFSLLSFWVLQKYLHAAQRWTVPVVCGLAH